MSNEELEQLAQESAENAVEQLFMEEGDGGCTCVTCIVNAALEAAWPHLLQYAREEAADG